MKRVIQSTKYESLSDVLNRLVHELASCAENFCMDNNLSCETWGQVNDFDTNYDETVDVNFSVTVDIPDEEE